MLVRKTIAALCGLVLGIATIPLVAIVAWPFLVAWFLYNEEEDE